MSTALCRIVFTVVAVCLGSGFASASPDILTSPNPEPANGNYGSGVDFIGDINGDDIDDLIVGARGENSSAGRAYVISGADLSVIRTHNGGAAGDRFGDAVGGGGDFDADGTPDYIVGAPGAAPGGVGFAGSAFVFSGASGLLLHQIDGTVSNQSLGVSVDFLGNIPRDEIMPGDDIWDDVIVGAPGNTSFFSTQRIFVIGRKAAISGPPVTETTTLTPAFGDRAFGRAVSSVGDFDGDGVVDLGIGAPDSTGLTNSFSGRGRAYVYSGAVVADGTVLKLLAVDGQNHNNENVGRSISGAGDFDGLGNAEVIIGSLLDNSAVSGSNQGAVEVFRYDMASTAGTSMLRIEGHAPNNQFGSSVAAVGDVDNDLLDDVLVGAAGPSSAFYPGGNAFLISGSAATGVVETLDTASRVIFQVSDILTIEGGDSMGFDVAGGGDIDDDGRPDWAVGAPSRGPASSNEGQVILSTAADEFPPPDPTNVAITAPSDGDLLTGAGILFTATADNADEVEFFVNGMSVGIDTSAPYAATFDSRDFPEGTTFLSVEARNGGGGLTPAGPVTVSIDNKSPILEITAPDDGDVLGGVVDFTATASDENGVVRVTFIGGTTLMEDDFTAPYDSLFDTTLELDGSVTLTVEAEDGLGNVGDTSIVITVDNTDPVIGIVSHVDGDFVSGTLTLEAAAADPHLSRVELYADGNLIGVVTDFASNPTANFDTTTLPDGSLALEAIAFDEADNSASAPVVTVIIDNTAPEKVIGEPADGRKVKKDIDISVSADDTGSGIASIQVTAGGILVIDTTDDNATVEFDTRTVIDGSLPIICTVTDLAGNQTIESVSVTVDNLKFKLKPNKLNLKSSGGGKPVKLEVKGDSVPLLAPVLDHNFQLVLPGVFAVDAIGGDDEPSGGGDDKLKVEFDRLDLISAINNAFSKPPKKLDLQVFADGQDMGKVKLKLKK